ncbi:hypothetical protein Xcel_2645 [Xylanimonas cellulosilytica DSM 15894]|uniref:Uncharacterized protein n=1 Tax=Xylanimonas cellulosilytica (strain DSM 15894 / JCM 12276 / CECT 5975 / KCTC 9989 / LMG 20990 / NBRC 107835 / XIL07) TaxID=446471 RepID=D1BX91_XYLCX|nr:DUF5997 family protein [Xylanimonas cellulosilytica]ACZ31659.1 hypothetical protein Xcel_2645 [Xylanimonas cellulosilytica DSM 15894]
MATPFSQQVLKPTNAAKRLGVYLPATPPEFQEKGVTRAELEELEKNPPEWLATLRREGPHPRPVVAGRLGVSIAGLARGGITDPLTTEQIDELRADPPAWLTREREIAAKVRAEDELAAKTDRPTRRVAPRD